MKVTIYSTSHIVDLNGVPARIWEGETESGVKVHCYITRVAIDKDEPRDEDFKRELQEHAVPSVEVQAIPLRMII